MKLLSVALCLTLLLCSNVQSHTLVISTDCNTVETDAGRALDLINKHRRDGYIFTLFRVADAHEQRTGNSSVLYLTLDVLETQCSVLSRKHWGTCELPQHNEMASKSISSELYVNHTSRPITPPCNWAIFINVSVKLCGTKALMSVCNRIISVISLDCQTQVNWLRKGHMWDIPPFHHHPSSGEHHHHHHFSGKGCRYPPVGPSHRHHHHHHGGPHHLSPPPSGGPLPPPPPHGCKYSHRHIHLHRQGSSNSFQERGGDEGSSSEEHISSQTPHPFHKRQVGSIHHIPVLNQHDVLLAPATNFPDHWPNPHYQFGKGVYEKPAIQPFPQAPSESKSCPGKPKYDLSDLLPLFPPRASK
uniref:Histidine-rich glycoprotein n=1 Tax=Pelusios castaneus TaxID=367368 RepID=A0A8C8RFJ9_9SAUR